MDQLFYWIGVIHAVAYMIAGTMLAFWAFIEWLIGRLKLKREIIRALNEYYKKRNSEAFHGG